VERPHKRDEKEPGICTKLAFREGRFGKTPPSFFGYFFLLEDCDRVKTPVHNNESYFKVDPAFENASYRKHHELLSRRLVLERVYSAA
jgi:hypothetical protein